MPITGGCRCGAIRYTNALEIVPLSYACRRRDCQTWSGSACALHTMLPDALLEISGDAAPFQADGMETMGSEHVGCAKCFTRIANSNSAAPGMVTLRAGKMDCINEIASQPISGLNANGRGSTYPTERRPLARRQVRPIFPRRCKRDSGSPKRPYFQPVDHRPVLARAGIRHCFVSRLRPCRGGDPSVNRALIRLH